MRTSKQNRVIVWAAILFTLLTHPSPAKACSCESGFTIPDYFAQYDAVFTGKIVRMVDNYYPIFSTLDSIMFRFDFPPYFVYEGGKYWGYSVFFKVIDSWKGVRETIVEVDTGKGDGDCGYTFELDRDYLIYASHAYRIPNNYWVTGTCGRTAELASATEDLIYLETFPTNSLEYAFPIMWTEKDLIIFGLPSLIIIGVGIFLRRRRKI